MCVFHCFVQGMTTKTILKVIPVMSQTVTKIQMKTLTLRFVFNGVAYLHLVHTYLQMLLRGHHCHFVKFIQHTSNDENKCTYILILRLSPAGITTRAAAGMATVALTCMFASMPWEEIVVTGPDVSWITKWVAGHPLVPAAGLMTDRMVRRIACICLVFI